MPDVDATASLWLVFLAGLSVGGLTCLAVQGGLLTTLVAQRALQARQSGGTGDVPVAGAPTGHIAPVAQFLAAKTIAYTALGAILCAMRSAVPVQLQGWILVGAGAFMVIVVLPMFDAHPFFRRFAFQPPKRVQRLLRQVSREGGALGPVLLGTLTVAMPCGVTLAMEALAIASNDPVRGALIMLVFTLGTLPLFLGLGFVAARFSRAAFRVFQPVAAVLVVVVALSSIVSGTRLLGLGGRDVGGEVVEAVVQPAGTGGVDDAEAGDSSVAADRSAANGDAGPGAGGVQEATIHLRTGAYDPAHVRIRAGIPARLNLVTDGTEGCIRGFVIPSLGVQLALPASGRQAVDIPASQPGTIPFTCAMGMYSGVIEVVQ